MTEQVTFAVGNGWPTPNNCRRVADALDAITPARYGDILRAYADAEDARFTLASSAPVTASEPMAWDIGLGAAMGTASEGATEAEPACGEHLGSCAGDGPDCWEFKSVSSDVAALMDPDLLAAEHDLRERESAAIQITTSSDGDRAGGGDVAMSQSSVHEEGGGTAQPEGVERVEWGVRWTTGAILAVPDERFAWNAAGSRHPENVVRRTVTEYAPVVGPWVAIEEGGQ